MVKINISLLTLLLCPLASWAADQVFDIKPGLWDIASTTQMSGMPPIPNLDQMPAEQRARIEAAMKNMSGRTTTTKSCVTKEGIEKAIAQANSKSSACTSKIVKMTASRVDVHMDCNGQKEEMKSAGDMSIERKDAEHFTGAGTMKTTGANGRSMDVKWSMTGTFVSTDCGSVKPAGQ